MDFKVFTGILLGAVISSIGYLIKTRQENKKYINEVMFNLLEIWKIVNMSNVFTSNVFPKALLSRVKERFPKETISKEDEKFFQKLLPQALEMIDKESGFPEVNLYERYLLSIQKLSSVQPVLAYSLGQNNMMLKYLKGMDNYIKKQLVDQKNNNESLDEFSEKFIADAKLLMESGLLDDLEKDLILLSFKSNVFNWLSVKSKIKLSRKRRKSLPKEAIDQYIDFVIEPLIINHYKINNKPYPY